MKQLLKIYADAPAYGKILLIIAAMVIIFFVYRLLSKALAPKDSNESGVDAAADELKALNRANAGPNYSAAQFHSWADGLEQAMTGQGTNEDQVASYFKYMQNKADVLALIKSFGIRKYTDDKLLMWNIKDFNLNQWISEEMPDEKERDHYINNQLKVNNINYSF